MSELDIRRLAERRVEQAYANAMELGQFDDAIAAALELVSLRTELFSAGHAEVANALYDLSEARASKGQLLEAAETLLGALDIETNTYGEEHPRVAEALHRLGQIQLAAQNDEDALTLFGRAVMIFEKAGGEQDERLAFALGGLATALARHERFADAQAALERALQCLAVCHGPESVPMAAPLESLAALKSMQGDERDALSLRERAARLLERAKHPGRSEAWRAVSRSALALRDFTKAMTAAESAIAASEPISAERAQSHDLAAEVCEVLGDGQQARAHYERALETYAATLPPTHPQLGVAQMNLATMEVMSGEVAIAEPRAREALRIFTHNFGPRHSHTEQMRQALMQLFAQAGANAIAESFGAPQEVN